MARYPALLRRTLPGEDGRVCGTGYSQCGRGLRTVSRHLSDHPALSGASGGLEGIVFWCGVCLAGYAVKVAGYALSTMLAHVSAYTILEGLRLQVADRLMGAPLGEVESRPIGSMKSTIVDRIEDVEPPLAHMIPELSSNLLLPLVVVIAMFAIDWRMGLALLVTIRWRSSP